MRLVKLFRRLALGIFEFSGDFGDSQGDSKRDEERTKDQQKTFEVPLGCGGSSGRTRTYNLSVNSCCDCMLMAENRAFDAHFCAA